MATWEWLDWNAATKMSIEDLFWLQVCKIAGVDFSDKNCQDFGDEVKNQEIAKEEFEAIEAMFQSDCEMKSDNDSGLSTILIKAPEMIDIHFSYPPDKYPSVFPKVLFVGKWERSVGVAFHVEIAKFLATLSLGDPMLFEVYSQAQNLMQVLGDLPDLSLSSPPIISSASKEPSNPSPSSSTTFVASEITKERSIKRRPKTPSVFWATPPTKTAPATSFCWNKSIERQRKSLPAWKARDDFLSKLKDSCKSSRVVLVTGDTGKFGALLIAVAAKCF